MVLQLPLMPPSHDDCAASAAATSLLLLPLPLQLHCHCYCCRDFCCDLCCDHRNAGYQITPAPRQPLVNLVCRTDVCSKVAVAILTPYSRNSEKVGSAFIGI